VLRVDVGGVEDARDERDARAPPAPERQDEQEGAGCVERRLEEDRGRPRGSPVPGSDGGKQERIPGRPERLALGRVPRCMGDPAAGDVDRPRRSLEEPRAERGGIGAVGEGFGRCDVGSTVRRDVAGRERRIGQAMESGQDGDECREPAIRMFGRDRQAVTPARIARL
jgi:hypothetical protein